MGADPFVLPPLLDVVLDYECNLRCTYCTISDSMRPHRLAARDVATHIARASAAGARALSLTGGEPTLRPELVRLVRFAREHGYTDIKVASNGLRYAYPDYLDGLVEAGVTRWHVSVHDYDALTYELTTQSAPGTFALLNRALEHLVARNVHLVVDILLMRSTAAKLLPTLRALEGRGVRRFALWLVSLTDGNALNVDSLPPLGELLPHVREGLDYARARGLEVVSLHLPRCVLPGYEEHVQHPGRDRLVTVVTPEATFDLRASRLGGQHHSPRCHGCRYLSLCPGLRADYVARYGEDDIAAVLP